MWQSPLAGAEKVSVR